MGDEEMGSVMSRNVVKKEMVDDMGEWMRDG